MKNVNEYYKTTTPNCDYIRQLTFPVSILVGPWPRISTKKFNREGRRNLQWTNLKQHSLKKNKLYLMVQVTVQALIVINFTC